MKYQLEYDKSLNAIEPFLYTEKNEVLTGVSLWLRFTPKFNSKDTEPQVKVEGNTLSYNELIKVSFNNTTKIFSFSNSIEKNVEYEVVSYSKAVAEKEESEITKKVNELIGLNVPMSYDTPIEKNEFDFIINKYGSLFENDNSLQTLGIGWYEIK